VRLTSNSMDLSSVFVKILVTFSFYSFCHFELSLFCAFFWIQCSWQSAFSQKKKLHIAKCPANGTGYWFGHCQLGIFCLPHLKRLCSSWFLYTFSDWHLCFHLSLKLEKLHWNENSDNSGIMPDFSYKFYIFSPTK
jgi:hypothetical protein